jgi:hypothetical protein
MQVIKVDGKLYVKTSGGNLVSLALMYAAAKEDNENGNHTS